MFESTVKFGNIIHSEEEEEGLTFFSKVVRIPTLANFFVKRLLLLQIVSNAASWRVTNILSCPYLDHFAYLVLVYVRL